MMVVSAASAQHLRVEASHRGEALGIRPGDLPVSNSSCNLYSPCHRYSIVRLTLAQKDENEQDLDQSSEAKLAALGSKVGDSVSMCRITSNHIISGARCSFQGRSRL